MSDSLLARVSAALEAIPHGAECGSRSPVAHTHVAIYGECDCDREERIAQRVTAAIEAAAEYADLEGVRDVAKGADNWRNAAVRALSEAP